MPAPWNGWLHCMGSTYGAWLYGDARGFRTRHHRQHVDGDYCNPPPSGTYDSLARRSAASMRFPPVILTPEHRLTVCRAMGDKLLDYGVELIELSVGGQHFHALCRFPRSLPPQPGGTARRICRNLLADGRDPIPRHILGRAKRAASVALAQLNAKPTGRPLWAKRTKIEPIKCRAHQLATVRYIRRHASQHAALWSAIHVDSQPVSP